MIIEFIEFLHECPHLNAVRSNNESEILVISSKGLKKFKTNDLLEEVISVIMSDNINSLHNIIKEMNNSGFFTDLTIWHKSDKLCEVTYYLKATKVRTSFPDFGYILYPVKVASDAERWIVLFPDIKFRKDFLEKLDELQIELIKRRTIFSEIFIELFENLDFITETLKIRHELSGSQKEIIKFAYNQGFFEIPKKTSIKDIARKYGISESAAIRKLKRAEKKLLSKILKYI